LNGGALIKGQLPKVKDEHANLNIRKIKDWHSFFNKLFANCEIENIKPNLHTTFEAVTYNPNPLNIKW
jgi:hypothetical protein